MDTMPFPLKDLLIKMLLSLLIGGIIGLERELRSKSAGFRTLILISVGATLFTVFSQIIGFRSSPDRIASNIVVGIGFMGAGVIFKGENRVNGITTAASIWVTAALGMGIGCGYYMASAIGCLLVIVVLFIFTFLETRIDRLNQIRTYKIVFPYENNNQHIYEQIIKDHHLIIRERYESKNGNMITGNWVVQGSEHNHHRFVEAILQDNTVTEFTF